MKKLLYITLFLALSHWGYAQPPGMKATLDSCVVEVKVADIKNKPIIFANLIITVNPTKDILKAKTDKHGIAWVKIPKKGRQTYEFKIDYRGDKFEFDRLFKIPQDAGEYDLSVSLRYEPKHMVLAEVQFETNKSDLKPTSYRELGDVIELMNLNSKMEIEILGHTDSIGDPQKNITLSLERANKIKQYLVQHGVNETRIVTSGHGPKIPIDDNLTEEGRSRNRRIEIKVIKE